MIGGDVSGDYYPGLFSLKHRSDSDGRPDRDQNEIRDWAEPVDYNLGRCHKPETWPHSERQGQ